MKKDIIIFGAMAGMIGNVAKLVVAFILYYLGLINKTYIHIAGGYFESKGLENFLVLLNAVINDFFYAAFLGVLIYLVLKLTDMKYIKIKGLLFGGFIHLINNGILIFGDLNKISIDEQTSFLLLVPTLIFGLSVCWFIEKNTYS
ncbi:hypothetical protein GGQ84_000919 [Desulfitispora alkaliphila]|uniref:hypothetical protein n=1 Tax=Desulfitispora alkaliphila TaxID=622674 RepID=UPI003D1E0A77